MIFLTIGTHEPFNRLVKAVDEWSAAHPEIEVFGQVALRDPSDHRPENFAWVEKMSPEDYGATFDRADLIVAHAGMGSIITALTRGKDIVILPRRGHFRETRNDHQFATVKHLRDKRGVHVALTESDLPAAIDAALASGRERREPAAGAFAQDSLIGELRRFIFNR